ncbi:hypothetical protein LC087_11685 [Bacillus carboniphilus]|uniref:Undecaprenyl-phosphate alpha-N-acetylglucosaminyl 1-phosphate transferase n=1 Tax=Bacillus carboniphilus TaxID=86663 RepID=A0ABY9JSS3_9BACI|nr:hypothetical protein [Bacillus carboniphilus]WLR41548.1 hypothetical protein LC087_11685 [Bacillus carboniphilus]
MYTLLDYIVAFFISLTMAIVITPSVIKFAHKYNFIDIPNNRKVHNGSMPRIGGLSIVIGAASGLLYLNQLIIQIWPVIVGVELSYWSV